MKKTLAVLIAFALSAAIISAAIAAVVLVGNTVVVTVNPAQAVTISSNATSVRTGDGIRLTVTLAQGMTDRQVIIKQGGTPITQVMTVGGVGTYDLIAVNSGSTAINLSFTPETMSD